MQRIHLNPDSVGGQQQPEEMEFWKCQQQEEITFRVLETTIKRSQTRFHNYSSYPSYARAVIIEHLYLL